MTIRRITLADLAFGEPLRWDIFGAGDGDAPSLPPAAKPVLQKGQVITPSAQLDGWLAAGLYVESAPPSVLHALNEVSKRLSHILMELLTHTNADQELRDIARELVAAVERDPDIALACIFLNQINGLYAVRHCVESAIVVAVIALAMQKSADEVQLATLAALTMNASMVRQTEGFQGRNGELSSEERAMVRRHPAESADLLRGAGVSAEDWLAYVMLHHENEDGSGYPKGKTGDEIPQNAKLISLSDRYCAHVSARNYRRSILPDIALHNLFLDSEIPADVAVASHFIRQIGKFPPGSLVLLENGEMGVVARRLPDASVSVNALRGADGKSLPPPTMRNTGDPGCAIVKSLHEDDVAVRFSMRPIWGELACL
ncbi:MAG: HD domain-containing phosphohydrolase [Pseudomonadota bacterium]